MLLGSTCLRWINHAYAFCDEPRKRWCQVSSSLAVLSILRAVLLRSHRLYPLLQPTYCYALFQCGCHHQLADIINQTPPRGYVQSRRKIRCSDCCTVVYTYRRCSAHSQTHWLVRSAPGVPYVKCTKQPGLQIERLLPELRSAMSEPFGKIERVGVLRTQRSKTYTSTLSGTSKSTVVTTERARVGRDTELRLFVLSVQYVQVELSRAYWPKENITPLVTLLHEEAVVDEVSLQTHHLALVKVLQQRLEAPSLVRMGKAIQFNPGCLWLPFVRYLQCCSDIWMLPVSSVCARQPDSTQVAIDCCLCVTYSVAATFECSLSSRHSQGKSSEVSSSHL